MSETNITINIASRPYNLKIDKAEENTVKQAVMQIENKINEFSKRFAYTDKQDLLAMVLLDMKALQLKQDTEHQNEDIQLKERLTLIDQILTGSLASE